MSIATETDFDAIRQRSTDFAPFARLGLLVVGGFVALFGLWALFAPLAGAVISHGQIVNDGKVQTLRHETGGVIAALPVREGETVKRGQVVAVLGQTDAAATLDQIEARLLGLDVRLARLVAERDGAAFPPADMQTMQALGGRDADLLAALVADQAEEFRSRAARAGSDRDVLDAQLAALGDQRAGVAAEIAAYRAQLASLDEDVRLRRQAAAAGYGRQAQLRELERESARLTGALGSAEARDAALTQNIAEVRSRLDKQRADFSEEVARLIAAARNERSEVVQQQAAAREALDRIELRAPVDGTISRVLVNTVGSAVEPFAPLVELVPDDAPLIVEARVDTMDIDEVRAQQSAEIVVSGLNRSLYDGVPATVDFISPSAEVEERTGLAYYTVRLMVDAEAFGDLPRLLPGMPVEVYFRTADYTFAQYLMAPISENLSKTLR